MPVVRRLSRLGTYALLCCVLVFAGCAKPAPERGSKPGLELVLLHSNDIHAHFAGQDKYGNACFSSADCTGGMARMATVMRAAKQKGDNVLVLDAGDQFQGTLFYTAGKWRAVAAMDSVMPYDAMTLGNHEFDDGCGDAAAFVTALSFPLLAANLDAQPGCPLREAPVRPWLIREVRGRKVGVVGLANPEVVTLAAACPQTKFKDSVQTLRAAVKELEKQGVRHIVALTHLGLPQDRELARQVDGVDIIVGGHTHSYLDPDPSEGPYPLVERAPSGQPVLVVTAAFAAKYLGELDVVFDAEGVPLRWKGAARLLSKDIVPDPAVEAKIAAQAKDLERFRSIKVGENPLTFTDGMEACRKGECLSGLVVTDAILAATRPHGAQFVLFNGGGLRAPLKRGQVTRGDILAVLPFGNTLVMRQYEGAQVLAALEHGVSGEKGQGPRLLQTAGLRYAVDSARPVGARVSAVEAKDAGGVYRPLDPKARYTVALPAYLARGGDDFAMLAKGTPVTAPDPMDADVTGQYISAHSPLTMPETGRVTRK